MKSRYVTAIAFVIALALSLMSLPAYGQVTTATLTGTVHDATGAVVPSAQITLTNEASGIVSRTASNGAGNFTFAAVQPGSYTVTVNDKGFKAWLAKGVVLDAGDNRNLLGIVLAPGATRQTVTVQANGGRLTPASSGQKSQLITQKIMQNVPIVGQNAAEFIKIMPGMAYTGGTLNQSSYQGKDEATGSGPVGSFSANGQRTAAIDITSDGADIIDPGCNCGQAENTNVDMTQELKVTTSNYGADHKGPIVITAIGKSGGRQFHGEGYVYGRDWRFNANDWLYNAKGRDPQGNPYAPRPHTQYLYPGFNIGGPVLIPGTNFNHNRNKLFFFFGMEYYKQNVDNGIYEAVVPTLAMRNGDFTDSSYLSELNGSAVTGVPNGGGPNGNAFTNGLINPGNIDPSGQALLDSYPLANINPATNGGFNYASDPTRYSNSLQLRGNVTYNINDSTKLYVSYNHQGDNREESLDTLWTGNAQSWASPTTPYPTPIIESTTSDVVTANLTSIISPTLTNEVVFSYTYLNLPNHFKDPSKVDRSGLGLNYQMLFKHANQGNLIMPEMTGWGDGISNVLNAGFELNGVVFAMKKLPSVQDHLVKVWGNHTAKFGFRWERVWNSQPGNSPVNGVAVFSNWGSNTSGNAYADMLIGQTTQYSEQNYNVTPAFRYMTTAFYGQDSWKVSSHLTLNYGLDVEHLGPWVDTTGYGFAAWYPKLWTNTAPSLNNFPGFEWHKIDSSVPLSGSGSRTFFYEPTVGFAWDMFGNGRTVL
ncbi:MAG: carboxypeptidase-like regulatory domain-containing protein, partial [Acidobacteriota bacterium]